MSAPARAAIVVVAAAALVAAFVVAQGSEDEQQARAPATQPPVATATATATGPVQTQTAPAPAPEPRIPTIRVRGGEPVGGVRRIRVEQGGRARFRVRSDVADQVHVHGYDIARDVRPGETVTIFFEASITGRFEIELEGSHEQIAELEVRP